MRKQFLRKRRALLMPVLKLIRKYLNLFKKYAFPTYQINPSVYDLYKEGIYYCDLKLPNLLYRNVDGKIEITLADIGGLFFSKDKFIVSCSFQPA